MNFRMIGQVVGRVLCIEAALMLLPMIAPWSMMNLRSRF